ncbi:hypothetical protein RhoFasGS6_02480 [Rhodococcus fascians]|nr:hypothetical protein [Rhodococcus fascians]
MLSGVALRCFTWSRTDTLVEQSRQSRRANNTAIDHASTEPSTRRSRSRPPPAPQHQARSRLRSPLVGTGSCDHPPWGRLRLAPTLSDTTGQLRASFDLSENVARLGLLLAPAYRRLSRALGDRAQDRRPVRTAPRAGPAECREHRPECIQNRRTLREQDRVLDRVSRETRSNSRRVAFAVDVAVVSMTVSPSRRKVLQRVLLTIRPDVRFAGDPRMPPIGWTTSPANAIRGRRLHGDRERRRRSLLEQLGSEA